MKGKSNNNNSEFIFVRKVLIEKFSIKSMLKWIVVQKIISIKNLEFEMSAKWRDLENRFSRPETFTSEQKNFHNDQYFELFEKL